MERDILAKGYGLVCQQGQRHRQDIYTLIQANQAELPTRTMCQQLSDSTSGYYEWRERQPSRRVVANRVMPERIRAIYQRSEATYGVPRIPAELRDMGEVISKNRVARFMQLVYIRGVSRRRVIVVITKRDLARKAAPDLVKRQFVATGRKVESRNTFLCRLDLELHQGLNSVTMSIL